MISYLIESRGYNPRSAPKAVDNYINSIVFAATETAEEEAAAAREARKKGIG